MDGLDIWNEFLSLKRKIEKYIKNGLNLIENLFYLK
jgi:hypothetical protein